MRKIIFFFLFIYNCILTYSQVPEFKGYKIIKQVKATPVKDQSLSPTCWCFATISFIESELLRKGMEEFDLSEMYVVYNVYVRKAIQHYRMMGYNFLTGGGQAHNVMITIEKEGLVPESVYSGLTNGKSNHNHAQLDDSVTKYMLMLDDLKGNNLPADWEKNFCSILNEKLGKIPTTFNYKNKDYTPKEFTSKVLQINPGDYIEITSYTHHPFYTWFCLESRYNWEQQLYYNLPLNEFIEIINNAINNDYSVCWNGDVSEDMFNVYAGFADLQIKEKVDQETRQQLFDNHSTTVDHVMHLIGIAKDQNKKKWYLIKNSWGTIPNNGYLLMSENYLKLKTVSILVHKDAIPEKIRKKLLFLDGSKTESTNQ